VLPAYALHLEGVVQNSIRHSVPFPTLPMTARPVHSRSQFAVCSILCSCQRGSGEFGGSRPAHYNQDFSTSSHVQLSGPRASSLKPRSKKLFLVRSSDAVLSGQKAMNLFFSRARGAAGLVKGSPRTAVLLAFCSCSNSRDRSYRRRCS